MKRLMTIALLATTSVGFSSTAHATAAACGLEDDVPTSACTAAIAGQDRQMSGDLAITVADCDATTPTASASYAAFWRDNTLCEGDWNEGWGFGTSNAATCDDSTGYGLFIKTLWLIEHAHHTHPFFTSQEDIDPADYGWTTGEERWVQKMGNFLRNKMRYLNRSFTPVNGDEHIALTWPSFNMELFCLNWFTMPAVLRASTLIHEARHYDAGTDHVGSCPDGSCDPSLGYKGSYWFQISWLESFHRYADETKTSLAARTLARDGANWLVQHRIASSNGYYVPDRRAHTRYRSSYASSMAPRAIDMVASPRDDRAKLRLERCGAAMPVGGAMFLGLHAPVNGAYNSVDELGQGPITLMSPAMGQKDAFWYRRSNG
ncbi:MAG: hypothetical protein KC731_23540, partial [Myxococcales bacterium]|nr:hypothetical protein [Myxococcales bacterium]